MTLHRFGMTWSLLLVSLCVGCDSPGPIEPAYKPNIDLGRLPPVTSEQGVVPLASSMGSGSTVKAPSTSTAVAVSPSQVDLSWKDNSTNESGFEVHRSTAGVSGAFTLRASTAAGISGYGDVGLNPSTQYCYKVRAFRRAGNTKTYSAFSSPACATTLAPPIPAAPSRTSALPYGSTVIEVSWADNSTSELGFRVERSTDAGASWATAGTTNIDDNVLVDFQRISEQQACYRVIAFNSWGDSPASTTDCAVPLAAPTNLVATYVESTGEVDLTWTDNSAVEDGYRVFIEEDVALYSLGANLDANSTSVRVAFARGYLVRATLVTGTGSDDAYVAGPECPVLNCP